MKRVTHRSRIAAFRSHTLNIIAAGVLEECKPGITGDRFQARRESLIYLFALIAEYDQVPQCFFFMCSFDHIVWRRIFIYIVQVDKQIEVFEIVGIKEDQIFLVFVAVPNFVGGRLWSA